MTHLLPQLENGSASSDPMSSREELDALLSEVGHAECIRSTFTGTTWCTGKLQSRPGGAGKEDEKEGKAERLRIERERRLTTGVRSHRERGMGSCSGHSRAWHGPLQTHTGRLTSARCGRGRPRETRLRGEQRKEKKRKERKGRRASNKEVRKQAKGKPHANSVVTATQQNGTMPPDTKADASCGQRDPAGAEGKKKWEQKPTAPGIPRRSPIQVLTRPDPA